MPFFYFDPQYMLAIAPAMLLAMWAQWRVKSSFASAAQEPAPLTGAAAARYILDSAGATNVEIESVPGQLTDHYDPQTKVLRLSQNVYGSRSLAAVGIAAHEAGHALQDHQGYSMMTIRNAAVGVANFGSGFGLIVFMIGLAMEESPPDGVSRRSRRMTRALRARDMSAANCTDRSPSPSELLIRIKAVPDEGKLSDANAPGACSTSPRRASMRPCCPSATMTASLS